MPSKKSKKPAKKSKREDDSKLYAFLATFFSIVGFIIALIAKKDNKYVMFYARQSLVIFIAWIIAEVFKSVDLVGWILKVIVLIIWILSWVYALTGEERNIPVIGELAKKIKI